MRERLGDEEIQPEFERLMENIALALDQGFNRPGESKVGFLLMLFPFGEREGRCNYISNANRADVVVLLKEQIARFEGMPEAIGRG
jgi:hypothetical protein